jgi:hypothetical protein
MQDPVEVTLYKIDNTYYAARSNEFGYANYEIVPKPPELLHPLGKDLMPDPSQAADQAKYLHARTNIRTFGVNCSDFPMRRCPQVSPCGKPCRVYQPLVHLEHE